MTGLPAGVRLFTVLVALLALAGCKPNDTPTNEVFVLVDLSETWLNPAAAERNKSVLEEVGEGIVMAADELPPPLAVQYRIIGDDSYERLPICDVIYKPMLVNTAKVKPTWLITRAKNLQGYLGVDCPAALLARAPEPLTEISAALASVAAKPRPRQTRRTLIVISDFLEETPVTTPLVEYDLKGVRVLLLYRPLTREIATSTRQRVAEWRGGLEGLGASVQVQPDTALKRADVQAFLIER